MFNVGILTVSDTCSKKTAEDKSGANLYNLIQNEKLLTKGEVVVKDIVPDDADVIKNKLVEWSDSQKLNLILTTGGTGFSPRDVTPEATKAVLEKEAIGLTIAMISQSLQVTKLAMLSRLVCGSRGKTLIVNLPGSVKGSEECFRYALPGIPHAVDLLRGDSSEIQKTHTELQGTGVQHDKENRHLDIASGVLRKYSKRFLKTKRKKKDQPRQFVGVMVRQRITEDEKLTLKCNDAGDVGENNLGNLQDGPALYEAVKIASPKADIIDDTQIEVDMQTLSPLKSGDLFGLSKGDCYNPSSVMLNSSDESSSINHILDHLLDNPENLDNVAGEASNKLNASFMILSCESIDNPITPEAPRTPFRRTHFTPLKDTHGANQSQAGYFANSEFENVSHVQDNHKSLSYHSTMVEKQIAKKSHYLNEEDPEGEDMNKVEDQHCVIDEGISSPENSYVPYVESDDDNPVKKDISIYDIENETMNENMFLPKSYRGLNSFPIPAVPKMKKGQGLMVPGNIPKPDKPKKTKTGKNKGYIETLKCEVGKNVYKFLGAHPKIRGIYLNKGKRHVKKNLVELKRNDTAIDQGSWKRGNAINDRNRLDDYFEYTDEGKRKKKMLDKKMARDEYVVNWYLFCPGRGNCLRTCGGYGKCINGCTGMAHKQDRHNCSVMVHMKLLLSDLTHWRIQVKGEHVEDGKIWSLPNESRRMNALKRDQIIATYAVPPQLGEVITIQPLSKDQKRISKYVANLKRRRSLKNYNARLDTVSTSSNDKVETIADGGKKSADQGNTSVYTYTTHQILDNHNGGSDDIILASPRCLSQETIIYAESPL